MWYNLEWNNSLKRCNSQSCICTCALGCNQETLLDLRVVVDSSQGGAIGLSGASRFCKVVRDVSILTTICIYRYIHQFPCSNFKRCIWNHGHPKVYPNFPTLLVALASLSSWELLKEPATVVNLPCKLSANSSIEHLQQSLNFCTAFERISYLNCIIMYYTIPNYLTITCHHSFLTL